MYGSKDPDTLINLLVQECKMEEYSKCHLQSLIIFNESQKKQSSVSSVISIDSSLNSAEGSMNVDQASTRYFKNHTVLRMIVVK